ncbi:unnamed protein product [Discosporangium mesarthrocarpum]
MIPRVITTAVGAVQVAIFCAHAYRVVAFLPAGSALSTTCIREARGVRSNHVHALGWCDQIRSFTSSGVAPTALRAGVALPEVDPNRVAVLFDFDGTVGDTETPAMEVAYWELAPYFPSAANGGELPSMSEYVRDNAGKAFEFMLEVVEADRAKAGLSDIGSARSSAAEDPEVMKVVDKNRAGYGLKSLAALREAGELKDILTQQKEETVEALSVVARPVQGMVKTLDTLKARGTPFAIATTSPKPRVPASVVACGLEGYFPLEKIHSGESDFDPPRFKPDPSVYLKAASHEGAIPTMCVAVEDSLSGVGSAANAEIGLIVGYVGASHIKEDKMSPHAGALMERGAQLVISDMCDLTPIVSHWSECLAQGKDPKANLSDVVTKEGSGMQTWL